MQTNAILEQDIVSTFRKFNPETIILFGSYAQGNPDEESDIDIIFIYNTPKRFLDRLEELYLSWDIPKAVDILAYTPDEFEQMKKDNAFIQDALKHARVIYERV